MLNRAHEAEITYPSPPVLSAAATRGLNESRTQPEAARLAASYYVDCLKLRRRGMQVTGLAPAGNPFNTDRNTERAEGNKGGSREREG